MSGGEALTRPRVALAVIATEAYIDGCVGELKVESGDGYKIPYTVGH